MFSGFVTQISQITRIISNLDLFTKTKDRYSVRIGKLW